MAKGLADFGLIAAQIEALAEEDARWVPLLANASALVMDGVEDLNWAGFYLMRPAGTSAAAGADAASAAGAADGRRELVLGPFQGKVACVRIAVGRGVCGTAVATDSTQLVRDVHEFAGHIACDSASNSEVVVPIHAGGRVVGVLDVDSPLVGRFGEADARGMETVVAAIERCCDFAGLA